jgi:hypothetical protein
VLDLPGKRKSKLLGLRWLWLATCVPRALQRTRLPYMWHDRACNGELSRERNLPIMQRFGKVQLLLSKFVAEHSVDDISGLAEAPLGQNQGGWPHPWRGDHL